MKLQEAIVAYQARAKRYGRDVGGGSIIEPSDPAMRLSEGLGITRPEAKRVIFSGVYSGKDFDVEEYVDELIAAKVQAETLVPPR